MKIKIESDLALFSILYSLIVFSALAMIFIFFNFAIKNSDAKLISISDTQNKTIFSEANISQAASLPAKTIDPLLPVRIIIPKIKLNAVIESVGLTKAGAVGVPKIPANTAWYNLSPRPGEKGSSIITGHYGRWKNGQGSVFDNLNKLKVGDKIQVKNQKGTITKFVVKKIQKYEQHQKYV